MATPVKHGEITEAPITEVQHAYRLFRKRFGRFLLNARREMDTPLRKGLVDVIAATAFKAGYNAPRTPAPPVKQRGWKTGR